MSISRKKKGHGLAFAPGARGMSLVELLVAMVIFIVLLSGLSILFTGAIDATRTGYLNQEAFERVRGSLAVIERDLTGAFTAREYGDYYQFFGGPQGFCFVGMPEGGGLARVTYVIHPSTEAIRFTASHMETYGNLHNRLRQQVEAYPDTTLFPRFLSLIDTQLPGVPDPDLDASDLSQVLRETMVDFPEVLVETQSLLRYVEPERGDLDTFVIKRRDGSILQWPELDLDHPDGDLYERTDPDSVRLYACLLDAFNPYVLPNDVIPAGSENLLDLVDSADPDEDMRAIYAASSLKAWNRDMIEAIYRAKQRELWIRMLAGEAGLPSFWGNADDPNDRRPRAEDYVVTDALLSKMYLAAMPDFDLMGTPQMFFYRGSYSGDNSLSARSFNSVERVSGYSFAYPDVDGARAAFAVNPIEGLVSMDEDYIAGLRSGTINEGTFGSPLFPRLPGIVSPGFWLIIPSKWVNSKDFLRWFTQDINVPSAAGRNVESVLTRRELI